MKRTLACSYNRKASPLQEQGIMPHASGSILFIEDSLEDFEAAQHAFRRVGLKNPLEHFTYGEEALKRLRAPGESRPSLIVLDLNMPRMSGQEVLASIKKDPLLKDIPVVILTRSKSKEAVKVCYTLGANAYLLKSDDFDALATNIKRLKEHWLDTVELPQVFDEERSSGQTVFSILEKKDFADPLPHERDGVYLSPAEVYSKVMGTDTRWTEKGDIKLTPREIETLLWAARGKGRWEISVILGVSEDTVKTRLEKSRQKLGAANTTHAIAIALLQGLLLPDEK